MDTFVFLDESGDPGFKIKSGSSPIFCLAGVVFRDTEAMLDTERAMKDLKRNLGLKNSHEFHFNHATPQIRKHFCETISTLPFGVRALVVDKNVIYEDSIMRRSPEYFYNFITRMLIEHNFSSVPGARIRIDGNTNRPLKTYIQKNLNKDRNIVQDIRFKDSKITPLIQLADMVVGAIARSYKPEKRDHLELRRILKPRIEDIWEFGKNGIK
jgi:hypothetical protein